VKRHAATIGGPLEHSVGHAGMQMHMLVERRAKAVLERDRTQPRAGLSRRGEISWLIRRMTEQPFDLFQKYPRQRRHRLWPVGQYAAQPLRHRDHPLPPRNGRNDIVSAGVPPSGPSVDLYRRDRPRGPCTKTPPESHGRNLCTFACPQFLRLRQDSPAAGLSFCHHAAKLDP